MTLAMKKIIFILIFLGSFGILKAQKFELCIEKNCFFIDILINYSTARPLINFIDEYKTLKNEKKITLCGISIHDSTQGIWMLENFYLESLQVKIDSFKRLDDSLAFYAEEKADYEYLKEYKYNAYIFSKKKFRFRQAKLDYKVYLNNAEKVNELIVFEKKCSLKIAKLYIDILNDEIQYEKFNRLKAIAEMNYVSIEKKLK